MKMKYLNNLLVLLFFLVTMSRLSSSCFTPTRSSRDHNHNGWYALDTLVTDRDSIFIFGDTVAGLRDTFYLHHNRGRNLSLNDPCGSGPRLRLLAPYLLSEQDYSPQ